ncbi:MAG: hypothetical protein ACRDK3_01930 [Actinomycetota bacterium]
MKLQRHDPGGGGAALAGQANQMQVFTDAMGLSFMVLSGVALVAARLVPRSPNSKASRPATVRS